MKRYHPSNTLLRRSGLALLVSILFCIASAHASQHPYLAKHGIVFSSGDKYLAETDLQFDGNGPSLAISRYYNSQSQTLGLLGYGWSGGVAQLSWLRILGSQIVLNQVNGKQINFMKNASGDWINQNGRLQTITTTPENGYQLKESNGTVNIYDATGNLLQRTDKNNYQLLFTYQSNQLATITDTLGRTLAFTYTDGKLTGLTTPVGTFTYAYDGNNNLISVTRPDGKSKTYLYQDAADIHNLTGIVDESGARIQTLTYDSSDRVITSSMTGGSDAVTITYPAALTRTVTDSLGTVSTYELEVLNGVARVKSFTGPGCSGSCGDSTGSSYTYTSRQQVSSVTDANGIITTSTYDANGNRLTKTDASGTPLARTITSTYTANNELATVTEPSMNNPGQNRVTTLTYDANGNMLTRTRSGYAGTTAIAETTTFTYNTLGQITSVGGPRTDVADTLTLTYYPNTADQGNNRGQLHTLINDLSQTTTYSDYTAIGKPGTITDANGLATTLTYSFKGAVLTRATSGLTTSYGYDDAGRLLTITLPGSRTLTYTYSGNLVASITDSLGNTISYRYDAKGQLTGQDIHDPANILTFTLSQTYDAAGNLATRVYPGNGQESFSYDAVHNLVQAIDPVSVQTDYNFDALGRLLSETKAGTTLATSSYDSHDNRISVTDARNHATTSSFDDLGRVRAVTSPDTGATSATYDQAGNLLTLTDAKGQTIAATYDALNRPLTQSYPGAAREIVSTYDQPFKGRLSTIQEEESNRSFAYNTLGQVISETRTIGTTTATVHYAYNSTTGELASITYPSGRVLSFSRDSAGQVSGLAMDGSPLVTNIAHLPYGPVTSATLGSVNLTRSYDQRYQMSRLQAGSLDSTYTRDQAGRVTGITNIPGPTAETFTTTATIHPNNNQLLGLSGSETIAYSHDANGNVITDGSFTYTWDALNRLVQVQESGSIIATYGYDSQNRRIRKTVGGQSIHYHYDLNNQLVAESLADGTPLRDYFYLNNEPIALREYQNNPGLYYYITDHLGTPRRLITSIGTVVWEAAYLPFGQAQVKTGTVQNNLRFPGQYFDSETGLHYNWNRYYDPASGRYLSADPIGLAGGMNLYAYVGGDPVNWVDPEGLVAFDFKAGTHVPIRLYPVSFGASAGPGGGGPEVVVGSYWDVGFSVGMKDFSDTGGLQSGNTLNIGFGKYLGLQFNFRKDKKWYDPSTWLDGVSAGLGLALSLPMTYTIPYDECSN